MTTKPDTSPRKRNRTGENPRFSVSVPPQVHARICARARQQNTSPGAWILARIQRVPEPPPLPLSFVFPDLIAVRMLLAGVRVDLRVVMDRALRAYEDRADEQALTSAWRHVHEVLLRIEARCALPAATEHDDPP